MRNLKAILLQDASNYVRESMDKLLKVVSKDHRTLAIQFTHFKTKSLNIMDRMDNYYSLLMEAELNLAQ